MPASARFRRTCAAPGTPEDQNVKLVQKAPFDLGN